MPGIYVSEFDRKVAHEDPLYAELKPVVASFDDISVKTLQTRYRLGFNRACRLLEVLAAEGVIDWDCRTGDYSAPRR